MITLTAPAASAVERQWRMGADIGWAAVASSEKVFPGWGGGAHLAYGLTDSYDLLMSAGLTSHAISASTPNGTIMDVAVGAAYTLDIVQWVPYVGLLVGGYRQSGGGLQQANYDLGLQIALGMDYRFSPSWSTGLQVKYASFSKEPLSAHYMTTFVRFEYLLGW